MVTREGFGWLGMIVPIRNSGWWIFAGGIHAWMVILLWFGKKIGSFTRVLFFASP